VSSRQLLFELFFEQSKTGDIVQGLPKIEQLFEARRTSLHVQETIHKKLKQKYLELSKLHTCFEATFQSIRYIQRILIDEIQTVYQSQGVDIADKHIEIIVRQMTSKVVLHETKHTSFFPGDVVDFYKLTHLAQGRDCLMPSKAGSNEIDIMASEIMEPFVLGITKVAFLTESFISAASFQEAKRVLMDAALESRVDFLYGLKENVIVGRFIRAGTGFQVDVFPSSTQPK
jgi:DNA-directed RNA polymerase subunit beta'